MPAAEETYVDNDEALTAGFHTYTVVTYIADNASDASNEVNAWIGPDALKAVDNANAVLNADGNGVIVSFDTLDTLIGGANGGYIGNVAYKVVRMPDEYVVAEAAAESPVVDDTIEGLSLGAYYYAIYVTRGDEESDAATTGKIVLGDAIALGNGESHEFDFSNGDFFELWTNSTADNVTHKWSYNATNNYLDSSFDHSIVFTPRFSLLEGSYQLEYRVSSYNGNYSSGLSIFLAAHTAASVATEEPAEGAMAYSAEVPETTVINHLTVKTGVPTVYTDNFRVSAPGEYYIGFQHNPSDDLLPSIRLYNVKLTAMDVTGVENVAAGGASAIYDSSSDALVTEAGAKVEVYSIEGRLVLSAVSDGNVSLAALGHGVYVVRVNSASFKIVK